MGGSYPDKLPPLGFDGGSATVATIAVTLVSPIAIPFAIPFPLFALRLSRTGWR